MWFVFIWQFLFHSQGTQSLNPHNDYCQHFVDTGHRPQNFIRDVGKCVLAIWLFHIHVCESDLCVACCKGLADRFEEYPKLRELIRLKDELIATTNTPPMYAKWILMFIWLWVQLIYAWITVHLECVHSTLLIPPFVMLQPYFKRDKINFSPQNPLIWFDFFKSFSYVYIKIKYNKNITSTEVFTAFANTFKFELRCIFFSLIILQMFL